MIEVSLEPKLPKVRLKMLSAISVNPKGGLGAKNPKSPKMTFPRVIKDKAIWRSLPGGFRTCPLGIQLSLLVPWSQTSGRSWIRSISPYNAPYCLQASVAKMLGCGTPSLLPLLLPFLTSFGLDLVTK